MMNTSGLATSTATLQTYHRAALGLDERAPPTSNHTAPVRQRLRELYVTCMCNAAVSGFKAAAAAPAPGEAHNLVVEACSRALERSGGKCPKVGRGGEGESRAGGEGIAESGFGKR